MRRILPEASGIVKSRRHPGIFWVHNDSGNPPALFAIRRDGTVVREFRLEVPNVDWEDIAIDDEGHLYLGDIGNNGGLLALRAVYRIDEPDPGQAGGRTLTGSGRDASTAFHAAIGSTPRGCSTIRPAGSAVLVAKRFDGREAELFTVPFKPPAPLLRPATPRQIGDAARVRRARHRRQPLGRRPAAGGLLLGRDAGLPAASETGPGSFWPRCATIPSRSKGSPGTRET